MNTVEFDDHGLRVKTAEGIESSAMRWDEVHAISAYQIDAKTREITILTFDFSWGEFVEVTNEFAGFVELVANLAQLLSPLLADAARSIANLRLGDPPVILYQR